MSCPMLVTLTKATAAVFVPVELKLPRTVIVVCTDLMVTEEPGRWQVEQVNGPYLPPGIPHPWAHLVELRFALLCSSLLLLQFEPMVVEASPDADLAGKNDEELFAVGTAAYGAGDFPRVVDHAALGHDVTRPRPALRPC